MFLPQPCAQKEDREKDNQRTTKGQPEDTYNNGNKVNKVQKTPAPPENRFNSVNVISDLQVSDLAYFELVRSNFNDLYPNRNLYQLFNKYLKKNVRYDIMLSLVESLIDQKNPRIEPYAWINGNDPEKRTMRAIEAENMVEHDEIKKRGKK